MAHSYRYLLRKAEQRRSHEAAMLDRKWKQIDTDPTFAAQRAWLYQELEKMVAAGELHKTPDGRYDLPSTSRQSNNNQPTKAPLPWASQ